MVQVSRVVRHLHPRAQGVPVVHHFLRAIRAEPAQIVHHRVSTAKAICPFATRRQHCVITSQRWHVPQIHGEPLHKGAVNSVVPHPLKMPQDGRFFEGAEHFGHLAMGVCETRGKALVRAQLRNVRPQINFCVALAGAILCPSTNETNLCPRRLGRH